MKLWLMRLVACVGAGCLWFLACADFDIWPLAWIAFVPQFLATRGVTPRRAFFWGWVTGITANAGGFYWITLLLQRFGHMSLVPSVALFMLLAAYQGLHFGLFAYLYRKIEQRAARREGRLATLPMTLLAPLVFTSMELIMPFIFPWYVAITQAWVLPVIQVAELAGPLGVTFLLLLSNGLVYDLILSRIERRPLPLRRLAASGAVIAAALTFGLVRIGQIEDRRAAAPRVKVGMVQANVGIVEKGRAALAPRHLALHHRVSRELVDDGAELLVWPESSYPYAFERSMTRDWPRGHRYEVMRGLGVPLIFGTLTYSREEKYPYNSAFMMEPDGRITGRFDKNFLLIFGEYIPFLEQVPQFRSWFPEASHFNRGTEVTTFPFRDWRIGPMICYEDIIPDFGRRLARLDPNLLVNVTNDAWFGRTSEPHEHLALAVYRSVELRLDMARSVNTGITAFISATGEVEQQTLSYDPVETPGVKPVGLLGEVAMLEGADTLYAALGDWLGYVCLLGTVVVLLWPAPRPRGSRAPDGAGGPGRKTGKRRTRGKRGRRG